jgi:pantothenate kinase-related protein Tda10
MLNNTETDTETQPELTPEMAAMLAETMKRAALWERVEALIDIRYTETEIVVGKAYNARHALKARGFRWEPTTKTWRFVLTSYHSFRMSGGRLQDCKIRRHPEPINWIVDVAKALGVEV